MAWNTPDELISRFRVIGEEYDDNELLDVLGSANRQVIGKVGRLYSDVQRMQYADQTEFNLRYPNFISFEEVQKAGYYNNALVDESNYTVDADAGSVTFDSDWIDENMRIGSAVIFYYVPERFKDLELLYAIMELAQTSTMQTQDDESAFNIEGLKQEIRGIEKELNTEGIATVNDHVPTFL